MYAVQFRFYIGKFRDMNLYYNGSAMSPTPYRKGSKVNISTLGECEVLQTTPTTKLPHEFKDYLV